MRTYPIALKLEGRRCLVVGGGRVARRKVSGLLDCGAEVVVVAPECEAGLRDQAERGAITLRERPFQEEDAAGARLVIAATDDRTVNQAVVRAAHAAGALVNVVDEPGDCDFYAPACIRRGDLCIAVSTGGACPSLAKRLREELDPQFGPEYGPYLELLDRLRTALRDRVPDRERQLQAEAAFLSGPALRLLAQNRLEEAEHLLEECLSQWAPESSE